MSAGEWFEVQSALRSGGYSSRGISSRDFGGGDPEPYRFETLDDARKFTTLFDRTRQPRIIRVSSRGREVVDG